MTITLTQGMELATILGVVIALVTLVNALIEYAHQGAQKRAEHFLSMRIRLKGNPIFEEMCALLERDDPKLETISFKDKRSLLGFFEEVALMMNSGLIRPEVVHYMFGYYAIQCWDSKHFWSGVNRQSYYWSLFKDFALQMKDREKKLNFRRSTFRF